MQLNLGVLAWHAPGPGFQTTSPHLTAIAGQGQGGEGSSLFTQHALNKAG